MALVVLKIPDLDHTHKHMHRLHSNLEDIDQGQLSQLNLPVFGYLLHRTNLAEFGAVVKLFFNFFNCCLYSFFYPIDS